MRARLLLPMLLAALPLAGCGGSAAPAQVAAPAAVSVRQLPSRPAPVVAKKKLIKRAERYCRRLNKRARSWAKVPRFDPSNPIVSVQNANAYARRVVVQLRRAYRHFHALGVPPRGKARRRWIGLLSQFRASIDHLDEIQAGAEVLDISYARESLRQLVKSSRAYTRRGRKLGLHACVSYSPRSRLRFSRHCVKDSQPTTITTGAR